MKKNILFIACCIGLMLFASCKKDPVAPTITAIQGEGYVAENAQLYSGTEIQVGFTATGENLTKMEITLTKDGSTIASEAQDIEKQPTYAFSKSFTIDSSIIGTITVTGIVTDAAGQTATKSFNIVCNEKPNAKFVGNYEGNALFTGNMKVSITGMEPMEQEVTDRAVPVTLSVVAGEAIDKVVATCKINDQEMEMTGTVEGNVVTFEAINTTVSFNYDLGNGMTVTPEVNVTYSVKGTLDNGFLALEGTCTGNGDVNLFIYNGTIELDGTIGGSLTKTE